MTAPPPPEAPPPLPTWEDQAPLLLDLALSDLQAGADVRPTMVAFRGDQPLFLATIRDFARRHHREAIIEVGALALALSADRVLLSLAGRAWSLADPIPPVLPGGPDLRQQVVILHAADASGPTPTGGTTIVPVEVDVGAPPDDLARPDVDDLDDPGADVCLRVRTGPALSDVAGEGWVPRALMALVSNPSGEDPDLAELGVQLQRCEALGHQLAWSPTVMPLIDRARVALMAAGWAGEGARPPWDGAGRNAAA